ncbi:MAG: orotate phosphoribosyltransferase [Candidatus Methanofastidiosia archaeon]
MSDLKSYQKDLIGVLVDSNSLKFGDFVLKSGRISPYFINMGQAISSGKYLSIVARCYCEKLTDVFENDFSFVFGPAYKGVPLACSVAYVLWTEFGVEVRWGYDRKEAKEYGDKGDRTIVGDIRDGDAVVIIDDVVTTGDTKLESWQKMRHFNPTLVSRGIVVAVDREETDKEGKLPSESLLEAGLDFYSILTVSEIFDYLLEKRIDGRMVVDNDIFESYKKYKKKYGK